MSWKGPCGKGHLNRNYGSSRKCVPVLKNEKGHAFCLLGFVTKSEKARKSCPPAYCITVLALRVHEFILSVPDLKRDGRSFGSLKTPPGLFRLWE